MLKKHLSIYKLQERLSVFYSHTSRNVSPMDFKLDGCLATGTSKCRAEFDIVWIRNTKDIGKYIYP